MFSFGKSQPEAINGIFCNGQSVSPFLNISFSGAAHPNFGNLVCFQMIPEIHPKKDTAENSPPTSFDVRPEVRRKKTTTHGTEPGKSQILAGVMKNYPPWN